jgi:hypothetical protein
VRPHTILLSAGFQSPSRLSALIGKLLFGEAGRQPIRVAGKESLLLLLAYELSEESIKIL